jgi:hypothetical protein
MNTRKLAALLGALALTFSAATTVLATGQSVDICHASASETNPYIAESPAIDSTGYLHGGHQDHTGPVWYPGAKAAKVVWGDIIPPYTYDTGNGIFSYPGLNWDAAGRAIWNNGCNPYPKISIDKTASVDTLPAGGGDVTYTYVVTNSGQVPLTNVTVTDDKCSPVAYLSGDTNSNSMLDLTESWTFTCSASLTETTTNTGTATGHDGDHTVTATDQATVTVSPTGDNPAIHVVKSADPATLPIGGGPVEYTYLVTNTGNVDLTNVTATDNKCAPLTGPTGDSGNDGVLGLTETWSYTCTTSLAVTTTNTVTATGHDGATAVSDTDDLTVTVLTGGVLGETSPPKTTAPPTDAIGATTDSSAGGSLPLLLIVMGIIGLGAVMLTPSRKRR